MNIVRTLLASLAMTIPSAGVGAENPLDDAKTHYAAAAYEEALSALRRAAGSPDVDRIELEQYRVLCLIGLGRTAEAVDAVAAMIELDPRHVPSPAVASPKVRSLITTVRRQRLPGIIRSVIGRGRTALEQGAFEEAENDFGLALALVDDDALREWPDREDVRTLADGFTALTTTLRRRAAAEAVQALPSKPPAQRPGERHADATSRTIQSPVAPPAGLAGVTVQPPVPILQTMPAWLPPDAFASTREYHGILKIEIGIDGRVKSARIEDPSHPAYDGRLLHAARQWVFNPATRDGQPVESEKVIAVQLHPTR